MKNTSSASSRHEKLVRKSAADIFSKPLSHAQKARLDKLAKLPDSEIDFSDIPELTDEQLARMVRRPPPKEVLSFRIDADVAAWLRSFPGGYSARANAILRAVMERQGGSTNA